MNPNQSVPRSRTGPPRQAPVAVPDRSAAAMPASEDNDGILDAKISEWLKFDVFDSGEERENPLACYLAAMRDFGCPIPETRPGSFSQHVLSARV